MRILRKNFHLSDSDKGKFVLRFDFAFFGSLETPHSVACMLVFTKGTSVQVRIAKTKGFPCSEGSEPQISLQRFCIFKLQKI